MIVAKYKFNPSTYSDYLPVFNSGFSYTKSDVNNGDGTITRTIESNSLPTSMRFGETTSTTDRSNSLLEILDMNTSNLTSMVNMFGYCKNLTSIVCNWNTSEVTDMREVFYNCSSLTTLNVNNWDTSNVTNMASTFEGCSSLTTLDVSNWNTSKVGDMRYIFSSCSSLTTLDLSKWNTSQVTKMREVFYNCSSLTTLNVSKWNTSKVTDINSMFLGCSKLTSLDLNSWDTSQVTNISDMFGRCSKLTTLDLSKWNTSQVTNMREAFYNCSSLTTLNVNNWDTSNVTNMYYMFNGCSKLTSLDLNSWDTSQVTNMQGVFYNCKTLTSLNVRNWNTSKVTNMYIMFQKCSKLTSLNVRNWNTSQVTNMENMFNECSSLTSLNISNWNISNVTNSYGIFDGCSLLRKVNLKYSNQSTVSKIHDNLPDRSSTTEGYILSSVDLTSDKNWETLKFTHNEFYLPQPLRKVGDVKDRFYWDYDKGHYCIKQNVSDDLQVLETPIIIDLPEMNKKITFDTYSPDTSIKVTNLPLQPYSLLLEDDTVRYKSTIEPSTLYTIQFNCLAKSTTNLTLDLGGTRLTVDPIIGVNHVQITTPSILASDRLFLIGTGIIVNEVIVNKGNMNQYTKYFDGEQSVGELQEDGSYIIVIKTNEGFTVTIRTSSPLTKLDKIYWNDTEKRYEIDRNGAIEVPTVEGDIIDLPRLYQKVDTTINISTDNIEPSKIAIEYNDINNN